MGQYVGIDLHRRSTTIYRMAEDGEVLGCERIVSQPFELTEAMASVRASRPRCSSSPPTAGTRPPVSSKTSAPTSTSRVPWGNNWGNRRVKNDERDAQDLAAMLRLGRLAEAWIAPPEIRELRELVRYRHSLGRHRTSAKAQIHGVMAKNGILPVVAELGAASAFGAMPSITTVIGRTRAYPRRSRCQDRVRSSRRRRPLWR